VRDLDLNGEDKECPDVRAASIETPPVCGSA
jgi:hypothetical protein